MNLFIVLLVLFATHVLGGLAAFGSALLALPLLLAVGTGLTESVALVLAVGLAQGAHMAWLTGRNADRRVLRRMLLLAGCGLPVGFILATRLPGPLLQGALGVVLLAAGTSRLLEGHRTAPWSPPQRLLDGLLLLGGVIHGAFGTGGAAITVYGRYALPDKEAFRGTLSVMWIILNVPLFAALVWRSGVGGATIETALLAVPVVLLATWLGHRLAARLPPQRFADLVAVLLFAAGVLTLLRNFS